MTDEVNIGVGQLTTLVWARVVVRLVSPPALPCPPFQGELSCLALASSPLAAIASSPAFTLSESVLPQRHLQGQLPGMPRFGVGSTLPGTAVDEGQEHRL